MIAILSAVQRARSKEYRFFPYYFPQGAFFLQLRGTRTPGAGCKGTIKASGHKKWDTCMVSHEHPLQKGGEEEKPKRTMIGGSRIEGNTPFIQISHKPNN
jgi:hypothetical protein